MKKTKSKAKRNVPHGKIHIYASFNNTIIMISDLKGNALGITSAGACGFRGGKKGTAYAAQVAVNQIVARVGSRYGLKKADVFVRGSWAGKRKRIACVAQ